MHAYSPVDVANPDYSLRPKFRGIASFNCSINPGEILFVPSHWWHQVTSYDDPDGKSIGVNYFYEPYYHRPGYECTHPNMQFNRHYSHVAHSSSGDLNNVDLCASKYICFKNSKSTSQQLQDEDDDDEL